MQVNGLPITVGVGSIISEEGFSMLMSAAAAESVWNTFLAQGAIPMASDAWERLRIYEGDGRRSSIKALDRKYYLLKTFFTRKCFDNFWFWSCWRFVSL